MKTKKILIILLILVSVIAICTTDKAAEGDSYKLTLTPTVEKAKPGDTITIKVAVSDVKIQSGEKGIGSYQGEISYDKDVFEDLKMTAESNWETPFVQPEGGFTAARLDGKCVGGTQGIATITLKVKSNAKSGSGKITIKKFGASNAVETIPTSDVTTTITVEGTKTAGGNSSSKNINTTSIDKSKITTLNTKLPHAGKSKILGTVISVIIIVGLYNFVRYKKLY